MTDIIQFVPKAGKKAQVNVSEFIALCRNKLTIFGADLEWGADSWDVTAQVHQRGRHGRLAFTWTNHDTSKANTSAPLMSQPYLDFARAYMRYQHGMKPTKNFGHRLAAVRALERALSENGQEPDIVKADAAVFNRAVALIKEKYLSSTAYRVGSQLELIGKLINDTEMVPVKFLWKNPLKRGNDRNRVGKEFDEYRLNNMPASGAIDALAKAFHIATDPADIIISSTGALLTTAPDRINELFRLPVNCEIEKPQPDGTVAYGFRWWPSKGADPYVKWIGSTMVDVAKLAIRKIREQTQSARDVAFWYEKNPEKLWLSDDLEHLRDMDVLPISEFMPVLGFSQKDSVNQWLRQNNVPINKIDNCLFVRFLDVETAVLKLLPSGFPVLDPETGLTYSDAIFITQANLFHPRRATIPCLIEPITTQRINNGLGTAVEHGKSSIFSRLGFDGDNGDPIRITTHQFRHWLNTIAQKGGLSQLDIAKWSGRKDVRQNENYDHVTADEMIMMVREIDDGSMFGPLAEVMDKMPVSREDFLQMKFPTAHTTEYGFCVHDYTMLPCQKHRDCINCTEHVCVKGDVEKTQRIRMFLEGVNEQIKKAEAAIEEGTAGADRWYEHHTRTAERLQSLVNILDNPDVPVGSVIQLAIPDEYSPIRNAVDNRKALGDKDADMLNDMRALMGGS